VGKKLEIISSNPQDEGDTFPRDVGNHLPATQCHNPDDHNPHFHRRENIKSQKNKRTVLETAQQYEYGCPLECISLIMEAVSTSDTSVNLYRTVRRDIPEDTDLHTLRP
jgi:hypothetical protein